PIVRQRLGEHELNFGVDVYHREVGADEAAAEGLAGVAEIGNQVALSDRTDVAQLPAPLRERHGPGEGDGPARPPRPFRPGTGRVLVLVIELLGVVGGHGRDPPILWSTGTLGAAGSRPGARGLRAPTWGGRSPPVRGRGGGRRRDRRPARRLPG